MIVFIETLKRIDQVFFLLINHDSNHRLLDPFMIAIRNPITWIPLYLFLVFYVLSKMGNRGWWFIILSLVAVGITDSTTGLLLKPMIGRLRPCYDPGIQQYVRSLVGCGGKYSFPSSHAANHFVLAAFWFRALLKSTGKKWNWLWVWATLICYAQVYVGKHYPSDVIFGGIYGILIGVLMAGLFEKLQFVTGEKILMFRRKEKKVYPVNPAQTI
jgi:membrane-associated phospholipid phosphatase